MEFKEIIGISEQTKNGMIRLLFSPAFLPTKHNLKEPSNNLSWRDDIIIKIGRMSPIVWTVVILFQLFHSTAGYRNGLYILVSRPICSFQMDRHHCWFGPNRRRYLSIQLLFCSVELAESPFLMYFKLLRVCSRTIFQIMWLSNGHIITDSRYKIKTLPDALSILRIEPIKLADANQTLSCTAENGIGSPVKAEAIINILNKG